MAERWGDQAYALGGWSGRKDGRTQQYVNGAQERWKPNMKVLKAVLQFVKTTKVSTKGSNSRGTGER
jgi:hypothetical protein